MSVDRDSVQYRELYWQYSRQYAESMAAQGRAVDESAQSAFAHERATAAAEAAMSMPPPAPAPVQLDPATTVVDGTAGPSASLFDAEPSAKPRKRKARIIVGGSIVAAAVVGTLVLSNLFGGAGSVGPEARMRDFRSEPTLAWTVPIGQAANDRDANVRGALENGDLVVLDSPTWDSVGGESIISVVDGATGETRWSVVFEEVSDLVRTDSSLFVLAIGQYVVASQLSSYDGSDAHSSVTTLDAKTGAKVSEVEMNDHLHLVFDAEDAVGLVIGEPGDGVDDVVQVLDPRNLAAEPRFEIDVYGDAFGGSHSTPAFVAGDDYIGVQTYQDSGSEIRYFDVNTGEEAPWSDGSWAQFVGGQIYLHDWDSDNGVVSRSMNRDGSERWEVEGVSLSEADGELFGVEYTSDEPRWNRVDPHDGSLLWSRDLRTNGTPRAVVDGRVLFASGGGEGMPFDDLEWVDLKTGEATKDAAPRVSDTTLGMHFASSTLIVNDDRSVSAVKYFERNPVWRFKLPDSESQMIIRYGERLYLHDWSNETISLLGGQ